MSVGTPRATKRRRYVWWGVLVIAIAIVLAVAWVGIRGFLAKSELESLSGLSHEFSSALSEQDVARALPLVDEIGAHAERAASLTGDPVWAAAEFVPFVGPNLQAARIAAAQVDAVMRDSAKPVLAAVEALKGGLGTDGALNASGLAALAPQLRDASATLEHAASELATIDRSRVIAPLASAVTELTDAIAQMHPAVDALARSSVLLPAMLGTEQPASILVMAQNNAELRTGGGITGTFIELEANAGHLQIVTQGDSSNFPVLTEPIVPIPDSVTALYGDSVGRWVQNTSMPADFELTAALAQARWAEHTGRTPSFVVSLDPIVLRALLTAVGPVTLHGAELNADNVVQRLLIEPYLTLDSEAQGVLFQEAVSTVFDRVSAGSFDPLKLVEALVVPVQQGRISIWAKDPAFQESIAGTDLAGPAARQQAAGDSAFSVYLNDATGGKMDVFLGVAISAGIETCRPDGLAEVVVSVNLTSNAPADAGETLPGSVTGDGRWSTATGDIGTLITVAAPPGYLFGGVVNEGKAVTSGDVIDAGFPSSVTRINISPGQSETAQFRFISPKPNANDPVVLHTPLLIDPTVTLLPSGCR